MNPQSRPERLFRYFPAAASDFFSTKKLWVSALKDLNDPFDALPRFDIMLEMQRQREIEAFGCPIPELERESRDFCAEGNEAVAEKYRDLVNEGLRLVCFSEKVDELLMWGHYASSHKGFVIEFDPKHPLFLPDEFGPVDYPNSDERLAIEDAQQSHDDFRKILFRKSHDWIYEGEWRLVKTSNALRLGDRRDGKKLRYLELPTDAVRALYFGWQIPTENRDELLHSLKTDEWQRQRVEVFIMRPHKIKYAVVPILWEQWRDKPNTFGAELDRLVP
ncbi:MAG TPA: DUF2971 domain-containing protein [Candidatus Limnocylindria bacterium]|nr:DUF2971 domain-containing protein [Candidatus Limnocylindria bacterium]